MKYTIYTLKLFNRQPRMTKAAITDLEQRGLLVAEKTQRCPEYKHKQSCEYEVTNQTAGDVVGYIPLSKAIKRNEISQEDARRLLVIEALRKNGKPRQTHIARLMVVAYATSKSQITNRIEQIAKEQWAKNQN